MHHVSFAANKSVPVTSTPQIIAKLYDMLGYLVAQVAKFPKNQRFLLGDRLELCGFDVLELLIEASYSREKSMLLHRANVKLEQMRFYTRLSKDARLLNLHAYEVLSKMINDVGVQLGGWIKQQRKSR